MTRKAPRTRHTRTTDGKARITLPRSFANATVIMERDSDREVHMRKTKVASNEFGGPEDMIPPLSKRDQQVILSLIDRPARANAALRRALAEHKRRYV